MQSEVDTKVARLTDRWEDKERKRIDNSKQYKWNRLCSINDLFFEVVVEGDGNCFDRCMSLYLF